MRTIATLLLLVVSPVFAIADDAKSLPLQGSWKVTGLMKGTEAITAFAGFATITVKDDQIELSKVPKFTEKAESTKIVFDPKKPNEFELKLNDQTYKILFSKSEGTAKLAFGHPGKGLPKAMPEGIKIPADVFILLHLNLAK